MHSTQTLIKVYNTWAWIHQDLLSQSSTLAEFLIGKDYDSGGKCNLGESRHCGKRVKQIIEKSQVLKKFEQNINFDEV